MRVRTTMAGLAATACVILPFAATVPASATPPDAGGIAGYEWSNAAIVGGGYVPGIIYSPAEEGLVYARTDIGGAYRLDRSTDRWIPLLDHIGWDDWNHLGVLSLASDPVDPARVYVAVGMYTNDWDPNNGAILRSDDYGQTWAQTDLPFKVGGNMPGRGIGERLAVDPSDNNVIYFGAEQGNGLWRSTDAGVTFDRVTSFPNAGDFVPDAGSGNSYLEQGLGVLWTVFDDAATPAGEPTTTIFTAVADTDDILYRSDDAGRTWQPVTGAPAGFLPQHGVIDAAGRFLYLTTTDTSGPYDGADGEVWRYGLDDGTWTDITPTYRPTGGDFGFSGLTVDRNDPDTIMVVSQIQWWPDVLIYRSTDRGQSWTPIWDYQYEADGSTTFAARYTQSIDAQPWLSFGKDVAAPQPWSEPTPKLGWMVSALEINPFDSDELLYGTGATIYRSEDLTEWDRDGGVIHIAPAADGIEETAILDLVAPAGDVDLVSAMYDLGGFVHDDVAEVTDTFRGPYFGGATSVDGAGLDPDVIIRAGVDASGAIVAAVSADSGKTWIASPAADGATASGTATALADGTGFVWAPEGAHARFSTDSGSSWHEVSGLPVGARVESDRVDADVAYGFAGGVFYRSDDGGATFAAVNDGALPRTGQVRFAAMPGHSGQVWLAGGEDDSAYGMWRSEDGGSTWTAVAGFDEADTIGFGKAAPGATAAAVYTAAERDGVRGVYRSTDAGATWVRINDDEHQFGAIGADIEGDPDVFGRVYIASNGRGIIIGDDTAAAQPDAWSATGTYDTGDVVSHDGRAWVASWWTRAQEPGAVYGPWQEIDTTATGVAVWTPTRIFGRDAVVSDNGVLWRAKWWTRGQEPGSSEWGPWERLG